MLAHPLNHLNYVGVSVLKILSEEECLVKFLEDERSIYKKYKNDFLEKSRVESNKDYGLNVKILDDLLFELKHHYVERPEALKKLQALNQNNNVKKQIKKIKTGQSKVIIMLTKINAKSYSPWKIFEALDTMDTIFETVILFLHDIIKKLKNGRN